MRIVAAISISLAFAIAGCLGSPDEVPILSAPDEDAKRSIVVQHIGKDLSYHWGYCVGTESPEAVCGTGGVGAAGGRAVVRLDGWTERLDVNLTWQSSTPFAERVQFWVVAGVATEAGFHARAAITDPTPGVSPFRIALHPEMQQDEDLLFLTEPDCGDPGPVCAHLAVDQHLRIDGMVWTRAATSEGDA